MAKYVQKNKVFVYGIHQNLIKDVKLHFECFGRVKNIESQNGKDYAFVEFFEAIDVQKALQNGEHQYIGGDQRMIIVKEAYIPKGIRRQNSQSSNSSSSDANFAPTNKIFVGGLPLAIKDEEFRSYFERFGNVTNSIIVRDPLTDISKGFGFVTYDSVMAAQKALENRFHNLNGKYVEVKVAVPENCTARMPNWLSSPAYLNYVNRYSNDYVPQTYAYHPWCISSYINNGYANGYYGYDHQGNLYYFSDGSNIYLVN